MNLQLLQTEMIAAMKAKNPARKQVISDIISTAKNMAIEAKCKDNVSEEIVLKAITKCKKTCQEQIDTCPTDRIDLLNKYKENMSYIEEFAPKLMTEAETEAAIYSILASVDMIDNKKGTLMRAIMPRLKGKADNKIIDKIVTNILNKMESFDGVLK